MKVTFEDSSMYLSDTLAKEAKLKKGGSIFLFEIKGGKTFGFHKGAKDMERSGIILCPIMETPEGELHVTPFFPPVDLMTATMRLPNNKRVSVAVKKSKVKEMDIFIFDV